MLSLHCATSAERKTVNETNTQNQTTTTTTTGSEVPSFKARCNRGGIYVPGDNPTPSEIILVVERRLADHQKHPSKTSKPWTGDYAEWKAINDDLTEFLQELRAAAAAQQKPIPPVAPISPIPSQPPIQPIPMAQLTNKKNPDLSEPSEPAIQPQQHPTEPQVSPTEPGSPASEPTEPSEPTDLDDEASQFVSAFKKIPAEYHQIAADLYEIQHYRSKFSKLTSAQRQAIYELDDEHERKKILNIIAQPAPIGMNLHTSLAALKRFLRDYQRILSDDKKLENHRQQEQERLATEQSFQTANASDESFRQAAERQIRKRLFTAASDPKSDHHEIRWLLKSLELLRKQNP
jgi:hypothetical protein